MSLMQDEEGLFLCVVKSRLGKSGSLRKSVSSQGVVPLRDSRNSRQVSACEAVFSVAYATCGIRLWACCGRLGGSIFV